MNPNDLWSLLQRGLCHKELKQHEKAMQFFREVARLHPLMPALRRLKQWMSLVEAMQKHKTEQ